MTYSNDCKSKFYFKVAQNYGTVYMQVENVNLERENLQDFILNSRENFPATGI